MDHVSKFPLSLLGQISPDTLERLITFRRLAITVPIISNSGREPVVREITGSDSADSEIQLPEPKPSNMIPVEPDLFPEEEPNISEHPSMLEHESHPSVLEHESHRSYSADLSSEPSSDSSSYHSDHE